MFLALAYPVRMKSCMANCKLGGMSAVHVRIGRNRCSCGFMRLGWLACSPSTLSAFGGTLRRRSSVNLQGKHTSIARCQQAIENEASKHAPAGECDKRGKESAERSDAYKSKRECAHGAQAHHEHRHGRLYGPILHMTIRMERPTPISRSPRILCTSR